MPPKKKGAAAAKIAKQESLKETKPELEISLSEPKRIPKKPFFRHVKYDNLTKVEHIRVKLWKIRSCSFPDFDDNEPELDYSEVSFEGSRGEKLQKTLTSPTIEKSLKHAKRIDCDPSLFTKLQFRKKLCSSWRLDSLFVTFYARKKFENYDALKTFLNSRLKHCCLQFETIEERIDPKLVEIFRAVRKCKLFFIPYENSNTNSHPDLHKDAFYIQINPAKLLPWRKLKALPPKYDDDSGCECLSYKIMINTLDCFQKILFECKDAPTQGQKTKIELPALPNLEKLHCTLKKQQRDEEIDDISFVKQYSTLENLHIFIQNRSVESLDFIADLPKLKDFCFVSRELYFKTVPLKNLSLPNLTQLEKFGFSVDRPIFMMEHVRDFISKNKSLKSLSLGLNIQNMGAVFEEYEDLALPEIEKLRLNLTRLERPYTGGAKRIVEVIKNQGSIKEFILVVSQSYADLNAILLKDGVAKMPSLEKLTLEWGMSGGLEDNKYKHLKDAFLNNPGLVALDLDISCDAIATRELGTILDGLMKLKNLKKFRWKAKFVKMTPAAFNKLSSFIVSLRHIKALEIELWGLSEEDEEQLREKMLPKIPLSKGSFSFHSSLREIIN